MAPEAIYHSAKRGFHIQTSALQADLDTVMAKTEAFHAARAEMGEQGRHLRLALQRMAFAARDEADARRKLEGAYGYYQRFDHVYIEDGEVSDGFIAPLARKQTMEELGRNLLLVRTELRQTIYPEVDLNLLDLLIMRRSQIRFFVDSGRVSSDAGSIYDVSEFAVGIGVGFAAFYDFMGFFPSLAFIEVATRIDEPSKSDDVQFLIGTKQRF